MGWDSILARMAELVDAMFGQPAGNSRDITVRKRRHLLVRVQLRAPFYDHPRFSPQNLSKTIPRLDHFNQRSPPEARQEACLHHQPHVHAPEARLGRWICGKLGGHDLVHFCADRIRRCSTPHSKGVCEDINAIQGAPIFTLWNARPSETIGETPGKLARKGKDSSMIGPDLINRHP